MVRVLVVEDSATARELLVSILSADPDVIVLGEARTGEEAVVRTARLRPDVVTMDIGLPGVDGLEATRRIMRETPTPIVIVSSAVQPDAVEASVRALRAGALAVLPKPWGPGGAGFGAEASHLVATVKAMAGVKVVRQVVRGHVPRAQPAPDLAGTRVVAIAASTGGPAAVARVLGELPADFALPVLLVQHMSEGFLGGFARHLDQSSRVRVKLAEDGERLLPGTVYVAPDGRHLGARHARVELASAPPVGGFRPSGTWLFRSVAEAFGGRALGIILTGMGADGVEGLRALHRAGGAVLAQDEATSVVYGMPRAAVEAGVVDDVLPLDVIADRMCRMLGVSCAK